MFSSHRTTALARRALRIDVLGIIRWAAPYGVDDAPTFSETS